MLTSSSMFCFVSFHVTIEGLQTSLPNSIFCFGALENSDKTHFYANPSQEPSDTGSTSQL